MRFCVDVVVEVEGGATIRECRDGVGDGCGKSVTTCDGCVVV